MSFLLKFKIKNYVCVLRIVKPNYLKNNLNEKRKHIINMFNINLF